MKSLLFGKRGMTTFAFLLIAFSLAVGSSIYAKVKNDHSPWHVSNGWGICGGYGTKYLKEIPTDIYPALYDYFHVPNNSLGAFTSYSEATPVDPKKESTLPHACTSPLNNIDGADSTFSGLSASPGTFQAVRAKAIAKARMNYSGVIPPGATKAIQILVAEYVGWPRFTESDPHLLNLQVDGNYLFSQQHDMIIANYPRIGWKVVFEYPKSEAPFVGFPPTGS